MTFVNLWLPIYILHLQNNRLKMYVDKNTPVSKLMTKKVVVANPENKFSQIRQLFAKFNLHHLPVTERGDKVVGIISTHDVMKAYQKLAEKGASTDDSTLDNEIKAADLMTKNPDTIGPNTTIHEAAKKFAVNRYHALPVVENGVLKGIITSNDLIKYILNE